MHWNKWLQHAHCWLWNDIKQWFYESSRNLSAWTIKCLGKFWKPSMHDTWHRLRFYSLKHICVFQTTKKYSWQINFETVFDSLTTNRTIFQITFHGTIFTCILVSTWNEHITYFFFTTNYAHTSIHWIFLLFLQFQFWIQLIIHAVNVCDDRCGRFF